jgi:hypothetical protein
MLVVSASVRSKRSLLTAVSPPTKPRPACRRGTPPRMRTPASTASAPLRSRASPSWTDRSKSTSATVRPSAPPDGAPGAEVPGAAGRAGGAGRPAPPSRGGRAARHRQGRRRQRRLHPRFQRRRGTGPGRVRVRSAGSAPADRINPAVTAAMEEIGIDLSQALPKPLTDEVVRAADVVVTMGCGDACPVYPGKRYEDWELRTRPASRSRWCAASATTSTPASGGCWPSSSQVLDLPGGT